MTAYNETANDSPSHHPGHTTYVIPVTKVTNEDLISVETGEASRVTSPDAHTAVPHDDPTDGAREEDDTSSEILRIEHETDSPETAARKGAFRSLVRTLQVRIIIHGNGN